MCIFNKINKMIMLRLNIAILSGILCFSISGSMIAQQPDSIQLKLESPADLNFGTNLDSMLRLWYIDKYVNVENLSQLDSLQADSIHTSVPDSVYIARLKRIPSVVDLTYNEVVRRYIEVYTVKRRASVEVMLGLSEYYFPIFDQVFDYYGVPNELKFMTIIESALNPRAYSRARAVGLWQFIYGTGRNYGLTINSFVDERLDPYKESKAAALYVKDLYSIFHDWTLVIAAYNCGPVNVEKAIRRSGGKKGYWDIYYHLPKQTRGHIPAFIAAAYVMNYYKEHNLHPVKSEISLPCDTIMINKPLNLKQVSEVLKLPLKAIRDLNPHYIRDIIPAFDKPYALVLPLKYSLHFIDLEDSIFAYKDSIYLNRNMLAKPTRNNSRGGYTPGAPKGNYAAIKYVVKSGDNLGYIAQWFHTSISDVKDWNDISGRTIREGQKLTIFVPSKKSDYFRQFNDMSYAEKQKAIGASPDDNLTTISSDGKFVVYVVKYGDTVWDIAKKYPGVTGTEIMTANNITKANKIVVGQKIKIPKRA
jgi:membrane-bound lytic murein transglycosylase D